MVFGIVLHDCCCSCICTGHAKKIPQHENVDFSQMRILIPNFPRLLNTHFFTIDVFFFIYLLNTLLSSEETKSAFDFCYSTSAQHDQQRTYPHFRYWTFALLLTRDHQPIYKLILQCQVSNPFLENWKFTSDCSICQAKFSQSLYLHFIFV